MVFDDAKDIEFAILFVTASTLIYMIVSKVYLNESMTDWSTMYDVINPEGVAGCDGNQKIPNSSAKYQAFSRTMFPKANMMGMDGMKASKCSKSTCGAYNGCCGGCIKNPIRWHAAWAGTAGPKSNNQPKDGFEGMTPEQEMSNRMNASGTTSRPNGYYEGNNNSGGITGNRQLANILVGRDVSAPCPA